MEGVVTISGAKNAALAIIPAAILAGESCLLENLPAIEDVRKLEAILLRMGAQVVSGIGFLGAGTIIVTARNQIKGLTTAAGLWASACVGLALGIGLYAVSIMGSVAIFVILTLLHELDFRMRRSTKQVEVYVELKHNVAVGQFLDFVRDRHYEPSNLQILLENTSDNGILAFSVTLKGQKNCNHDDIVTTVKTMPGIGYVEEL